MENIGTGDDTASHREMEVMLPTTFYLGFDCATKTFGFSLIGIRAESFNSRRKYLRQRLRELKVWVKERPTSPFEILQLSKAVQDLDTETKSYLSLIDGETKDLFPNRPDKSIHTVERLRALSNYVHSRIAPSIEKNVTGPLEVVIEFQEGANAKTRIIAPSLATLFIDRKVYFVGPTLKNKIHLSEEGRYCHFAEKYARNYDANKAHVKYNFAILEGLFDTRIPVSCPLSLRGHIGDACMMVIGHLKYGHTEDPENHY
jgi:hypothetical protein